MKISYNWLLEYVDVKNSAKQAAQWLTMAGLEVTSLEEKGKDAILEIEVTTNRPDWLSVIGVARELSTITGKRLRAPKVSSALFVAARDKQIALEIHDKLLCPRYTARIIDAVKMGPSTAWIKGHLEAIGVRPINNVVDITNFCLFELGQPLHAFDYDKLIGQKIIVRRAKKGERIVTIDKVQRELDSDMLVIADEKRPVAIAGVMGGLDTEVNEGTRAVLLESACFDPASVRKTQRRLGLSTDSSYRFERGVDPEGILFASNRAANLIAEHCDGKIGILKDAGQKAAKTNAIKLSVDHTNEILNLTLSPVLVKRTLESLGMKVSGAQEQLRVEIPSFRRDLKREQDLIEEVARIYGYEKIPMTIPRMVGHPQRKAFSRKIQELARDVLAGEGLDEVITYSMISRADLDTAPLLKEGEAISISNPLSSEQEMMRPSLLCGVLGVARFNINRKIEDIGIFELSNVYSRPAGNEGKERANICILMSGGVKRNWRQDISADFFEIKGVVETLLEGLGIEDPEFRAGGAGIFYPERSAIISVKGKDLGVIGELKKELLGRFDIKKEAYFCEVEFEKLLEFVNVEKRFCAPPKFIPAKRDISLVVKKDIPANDLISAIREAGGELLKKIALSDEYFGQQIPTGKRGLTFSLEYLSRTAQLTEEEIETAHSRIKSALTDRFGANLR